MKKKSMKALSVALAAAMMLSCVNPQGTVFAAEKEDKAVVEKQVAEGKTTESSEDSKKEAVAEEATVEEKEENVTETVEEQDTVPSSETEKENTKEQEPTEAEKEKKETAKETEEEEELHEKFAASLSSFMPDAELQKAVLAAYNAGTGQNVDDLTQGELRAYTGALDLTTYAKAKAIKSLAGLGAAKNAASIDTSTCTGVTSIDAGEFLECNFTEMKLPNTITVINENAFKDCTKLTSITLPDTLTKIGSHAFAACSSLASVNSTAAANTLPASLTSVGQQVFVNDVAITEIALPNFTNGRVLENSASLFSGCKGLSKITIGKNIKAIPAEAFGGAGSEYKDSNGGLTVEFETGSTLEKILTSAFSKAHFKDSTIDLSKCTKLNSIADSVFDYATNVDTVILPKTDSLEIGAYAFANTTLSTMYEAGNVQSGIYLPDSVRSIGKGCFCIYVEQSGNNSSQQKEPDVESKITSVSLSPNLKDIPDYTFDGCTALSSVTQRSTSAVKVAAIGDCAFRSTAITNTDFMSKMTNLKTIGYQQLSVYGVGIKKTDLEKVQSLPQGGKDGSISENAVTHQKKNTKNVNYVYGSEVFTNCRKLTSVTIPASVTSIGSRAFFFSRVYKDGNTTYGGNEVKEEADVKTASNIETICWKSNGAKAERTVGSEAFHGNVNVTELTLPENTGDTLAVKPYAFYEMKSLESIKLHKNGTLQSTQNQLPATLSELGEGAFFWCASLLSVKVPSCPQEKVGKSVFEKCVRLADVVLPGTWTEIPERLCYDSSVASLSMSGGESKITKIGDGAFFGCRFETLDLSRYTSLEEIGSVAFALIDTINKNPFNPKEPIVCYNAGYLKQLPVVETVILPDSVAKGTLFLNSAAFCGQMSMTTLKTKSRGTTGQFYMPKYIPNDTTNTAKKKCGMGVFAGTAVTKMVYEDPASWTEIPTLMFDGCGSIQRAEDVLPASKQYLKGIGQAAFVNSNVTSADLSGYTALTMIGSTGNGSALDALCPGVFQGCTNLTTVKMPKTAYTLGKRTFFMAEGGNMNTAPEYTKLTSVDLGGVTKIEEYAFTQAFSTSVWCDDKVTITIPESCTTMGNYAFYKNTRLEKVILPDSLSAVGTYAFAENTGLTTVDFGKVKKIDNYAFSKCSSLVLKTGYQLPDTLETIGTQAFSEDTSLGTVVFGSSLTTINANAFDKAGITSVDFGKAGKLATIGAGAFSHNNSLTNFKLTGTKVATITTILQGCLNLQKVQFGDEVTYIGDNALSSCPKLHTLQFASTTTVSTDVFKLAPVSNTYTASDNNYTITLIVDTPKEPVVIPKGRTVNFPYYVSPQTKSNFNYILIGKDKTEQIDTIDTYLGVKASLSDGCFKVHQSNEEQYKVTEPYYTSTAQSSLYTTVNNKKVDTIQVEGLQATEEPVTFSIANSITFNLANGGTVSASKFVANYKVTVKDVETNGYLYADKERKQEISNSKDNNLQAAINGQKYQQCWYSIKDSETTCADIEDYDLVIKTDNPDVLIPGRSSGVSKNTYDAKNGVVINGTKKTNGVVSANTTAQTFYLVAQGVGTAHITIYPKAYPECKRTFTYKVNADVNRITLSIPLEYNSKALEPGTTFNIFKEYTNTLNQKVTSEDMSGYGTYTNNKIVFESNKPEIASIDERGTVTIKKTVPANETVTFTAKAYTSVSGRETKATIGLSLRAPKTTLNESVVDKASGTTVAATKVGTVTTPGEAKFVKGSSTNGTNVVIPDTVEINGIKYKVTTIDANAFKGNTKLTSVTVGNNIKNIDNEAFKGCTSLKTVTISNSVEKIGKDAFYNCNRLTTVNINAKAKIKEIGEGAFRNCSALLKITIPNETTKIGKNAFNNCKKLKTVTWNAKSSKLTEIGISAFQNCAVLAKIVIPNKVKKINAKAFYNCKKLKTVTIDYKKSALTEIGDSAFQNCYRLSKITLPKKLTRIGKKAFYNCKKLKTITVKATKVSSVGANAFKNIYKKAVIKVPKKQYKKYKTLFKGKGQKKTVKIKK